MIATLISIFAMILTVYIANSMPLWMARFRCWKHQKSMPIITPETKWRIISKMNEEENKLIFVVQCSDTLGKNWYPLKKFSYRRDAMDYLSERLEDNKVIHTYDPQRLLDEHKREEV